MPHYLNLNVLLRYDFIVTYLAVMFFIYWIIAKVRITRLSIEKKKGLWMFIL